ncbi:Modification methylase NlaIII, partial [hydrothermal vent metagenome]
MNYIGSKHKLSSFIQKSIKEVVGDDLSGLVFCDLFAGTGIVGRNFKPLVKQVIANDIEWYSYILNRNYIGNYKSLNCVEKIKKLNNLKGFEGFIFHNYC